MKHKKQMTCLVFLLLGLGRIHGQESPTSAGGEASGPSGVISYSIGQPMNSSISGDGGTVTYGVQQAYEISTTLGIDDETINLELSVYPNPTANYLTLKVDETDELIYQLYNLQGKVIKNEIVNNNSTNIDLQGQPSATYFLAVLKNKQIVKTFKIVKTQ